MTRPWEPVPGGWIAPGPCGTWHYVPRDLDTWVCLFCRHISTFTLRSEHEHRNGLYYPEGDA